MRTSLALAKVTPPNVGHVFTRAHLNSAIEEMAAALVVWVAAPPGSGKSTTIAHYLAKKECSHVWYRVDEGDEDPASFFHYLVQAVHAHPKLGVDSLPVISHEYLSNLETFARNFFRQLFSTMAEPFVLVLDNHHKLSDATELNKIIEIGIEESPSEIRWIITSHHEPSPSFAKLQLSGALALLERENLAFSLEEICALGKKLGKPFSSDELQEIYQTTQGWAIAVLLMLNSATPGSLRKESIRALDFENIYHYFQREIFDHFDEETKVFIERTAYLELFTAEMFEEISGCRLESLLEMYPVFAHLISASCVDDATYEYHPLFQSFLKSVVEKEMLCETRQILLSQSTKILNDMGDWQRSIPMLLENESWSQAIPILMKNAFMLIRQGRHNTLRNWISRFPEQMVEQTPWLQFWLGASQMPTSIWHAGQRFEQAHKLFEEQNDNKGLILSCCGKIDSIVYTQHKLNELAPWIDKLEQLLEENQTELPPYVSAWAYRSMLFSLVWFRPEHPKLDYWVGRCKAVWESSEDVEQKIHFAQHLSVYYVFNGELAQARHMLTHSVQLHSSEKTGALSKLVTHTISSFAHWALSDYDTCQQQVDDGLKLSRSSGIYMFSAKLMNAGLTLSLTLADHQKIDTYVQQLKKNVSQYPGGLEAGRYLALRAWKHFIDDELDEAWHCAKESAETCQRVSALFNEVVARIGLVFIASRQGDKSRASDALHVAKNRVERLKSPWMRYAVGMGEAYYFLRFDQPAEASDVLRDVLDCARRYGYIQIHFWHHDVMGELFAHALRNSICPRHVAKAIQKSPLGAFPAPADIEHWPRPLRIYTLGRFLMVKEGEEIKTGRKKSNKPIEVLKLIIALGGKQVSVNSIAETLWPELYGDAAYHACATALTRLRKIIGVDAIESNEGRLTLDPRYVWVDTWSIRRLTDDIAANISLREQMANLKQAYKGTFLEADGNEPWIVPMRQQLKERIVRKIVSIGESLMVAGEWESALQVFYDGLEFDMLSENCCQGVMSCCSQLERYAEGVLAYQQFRNYLNKYTYTQPSKKTEMLRSQLQQYTSIQ